LQYRRREATTAIIVHASHTHPSLTLDTYQHLKVEGRRLGLLDIGYHYVIERDGLIVLGRPHWAVGSHWRTWNPDSVAICMANDVAEPLTPEASASLTTLIHLTREEFGNSLPVYSHCLHGEHPLVQHFPRLYSRPPPASAGCEVRDPPGVPGVELPSGGPYLDQHDRPRLPGGG
jgi:hypothetical protein